MSVIDAFDSNNEVLRGLITWSGILLVKMLLMSFWTGFHRFRNGVSLEYKFKKENRGKLGRF